jgi:hypothetical protein
VKFTMSNSNTNLGLQWIDDAAACVPPVVYETARKVFLQMSTHLENNDIFGVGFDDESITFQWMTPRGGFFLIFEFESEGVSVTIFDPFVVRKIPYLSEDLLHTLSNYYMIVKQCGIENV